MAKYLKHKHILRHKTTMLVNYKTKVYNTSVNVYINCPVSGQKLSCPLII